MGYFKAFFAVVSGLNYCCLRPAVRRYAVWPWLVGLIVYVGALAGALYVHPRLVAAVIGEPAGFLGSLLFAAVWLLFAFLLFLAAGIISVILVMIFAGVFQSSVAAATLRELGEALPEEPGGWRQTAAETLRTVRVEVLKLFWIIPIMLIVLLAGLIPLFSPIALVLGSWLLAFQFIDVVLDLYKVGAWERFKFSISHFGLLVCFGLGLTVCWAIPFVGVISIPVAASGAAWLLHQQQLLPSSET